MFACGENREDSWINPAILRLYRELHEEGDALSLECWEGAELVGGIYGVSLGGAFFGESMFSRRANASKVALVTLAKLLREAGYRLFDTQYQNPHIRQFGVVEISQAAYLQKLAAALAITPRPLTLSGAISAA